MSYIFVIILFLTNTESQWISATPRLPYNNQRMSIGYYNNAISIIGGIHLDIIEYDILSNSFITYNDTLSAQTTGYAQYWTQMDNVVFMLNDKGQNINHYNLLNKQFIPNWMNFTIPVTLGEGYGCITSSDDILYIVGGYNYNGQINNHLQILDLTTNEWTFGPNSNEGRSQHSCVINPITNKLYAIGGANEYGLLNSIEYIEIIDIEQKSWNYIQDTLIRGLSRTRSVSFDKYIYVIGGYYYSSGYHHVDDVHIIDTETNVVSLSSDKLVYEVSSTAAIIIKNRIYAFGGDSVGSYTNKFQYIDIATNEPTTYNPTTSEPTNFPSTTLEPTTNEPTTNGLTTTHQTTSESTNEAVTTITILTRSDSSNLNIIVAYLYCVVSVICI